MSHVADTFCEAMAAFCADPLLRFLWMRFLPVGRAFDRNPLWQALSSQVVNVLKQERVLYLHDSSGVYSETLLSQPLNVRILPSEYLDQNREPLFADRSGRNRKYLSLHYDEQDVQVLRSAFGLQIIEDIHIFHRLTQDLSSPNSRMKALETENDWHIRAANLILSVAERSSGVRRMIEDQSDLIPLSNGHWTTANSGDIYFPPLYGPSIPLDLVTTIDDGAANNIARRRMFEFLGVTEIQPAQVIDRLWRSYAFPNEIANLNVSKGHLRYLYWHHRDIEDARFSRLQIYDHNLRKVQCHQGLIYMPSEDEYGPNELLKAVPHPQDPNRLIPEYPVAFINSEYTNLFHPSTRRRELSWSGWLERALRIRRIPRLKYDLGSLSPEFRHILRYRPEKTVKLLEMHWRVYRREMTNRIEEEISQAEVACQGASLAILSRTYFPVPTLLHKAQELRTPQEFPFLNVPGFSQEDIEDWRFLERFGVKFEANLNFYLDILRQHKASRGQVWSVDVRNGVMATYELIADQCNQASRETVM